MIVNLRWPVLALVALSLTAAGCSGGSHQARLVTGAASHPTPTPPRTHDEIALYNDSGSTVRVLGCTGCSGAGKPVDAGEWLTLNLPPNKMQLRLVQPTSTTCVMVVSGVVSGKPLVVKVSESAASAC